MSTFFRGGRYESVRALGAGGMSCVYLARDCVLSREVALKVLDERHAGSEEFVERLRREAKAAASLSHPNIVAVYDYGENEQGTPYIAMEHVPGGTLKDTIQRRGKLPSRVAAGVALQITSALQTAHESGIVHRDVKPENVLVTEDGNVKVGDFGIARAAEATAVTATSAIVGSVRYLSPEQASGQEVGAASDLYSLGVVLYEMITGEVPFRAENPIANAMMHLTQAPAPPSEFDSRIPAALEAVTLKLLEKDPADRYPSAGALMEDLKRVLAGAAPATSFPQERISHAGQLPERPPRRRRRQRIISTIATIPAVAMLAAVASGVGMSEESPLVRLIDKRAQEPLPRVEAPATVAGGEQKERAALAAPEPPPEQAHAAEDGGQNKKKQEQPSQPDEKDSKPQQLAVQAVAHKEAAPPAAKSAALQPAQRQEPETVAVPGLAGMSVAEAEVALARVGLLLRVASLASREDVPEGVIIYQDAPPGYKAYPGATVAVTVSSSPPAASKPKKVEPVEPQNVEPPEVETAEPVKEKAAPKDVSPEDLEAKRKSMQEKKASDAERRRDRARDDRPGARDERRRAEQHPVTEKRPHQEGERRASLREANDRGNGDGGREPG